MDEKIYTITLSDGTQISDLRILFQTRMRLVQITQVDNKYWFILRDLTNEEITREKLRADIDL